MKRLLHKIQYSLALRLMLLSLLTMLGVSIIFFGSTGHALRNQFRNTLLPHVLQYQQYINQDIGTPPDLEKARQLANRLSINLYIAGPDLQWSSTGQPFDGHHLTFRPHANEAVSHARYHGNFYLRSSNGGYTTTIAMQRHETDIAAGWKLASMLGLFTVLGLSYLAIRRLFRPIETIRSGINKIGDGDLDFRIQTPRKDELGDLADSINHMASDIQAMLDAKRTLLLAISHELRSPITRSRVSVALLEDSGNKEAIRHDLAEMETLISELLETEKLSQRHVALNRSLANPDTLIMEVIATHFADRNIETRFEHTQQKVAMDSVRIRLLIRNLLENALRHHRPDKGTVAIHTHSNKNLTIEVIDHGPGIAPEHIEHLTDAFYRADPSRQRKTGGYGLGLYLCKAIVEAHGGTLEINSKLDEGTVVSVMIPVEPR